MNREFTMKELIKSAFIQTRRIRERLRWQTGQRVREALTPDEKALVDALWGDVWSKPSYKWHEHFKRVNGKFDPRYLPCDVFYLDVLPKLSNLDLAAAWEDKSYYNVRFPEVAFPQLLGACVDGELYDSQLTLSNYKEMYLTLKQFDRVFVKPSLGSYQGVGAFCLSLKEVRNSVDLSLCLSEAGENFVIQRLITQHEIMASFNPDSVNIIRVNSLNIGGGPLILNSTIRFGIPGRVTDMCYVNGIETVRIVGLDEVGSIRDCYVNQDGLRFPTADITRFYEEKIPNFQKACQMCLTLHKKCIILVWLRSTWQSMVRAIRLLLR